MRAIAIVTLLLLCACDDHGKGSACIYMGTSHAIDEVFPAGDGCNSCTCTTSGPACTDRACVDGGVDANPLACGPSSGCPQGPACGAACCKGGERCVSGTCQCGMHAACGTGDSCERAGPVGGDLCGTVCCGVSGPCPQ